MQTSQFSQPYMPIFYAKGDTGGVHIPPGLSAPKHPRVDLQPIAVRTMMGRCHQYAGCACNRERRERTGIVGGCFKPHHKQVFFLL